MKIGLDAAWLASKRIVDRIILVTADSDFIPAMSLHGVRVCRLFGHLGSSNGEAGAKRTRGRTSNRYLSLIFVTPRSACRSKMRS